MPESAAIRHAQSKDPYLNDAHCHPFSPLAREVGGTGFQFCRNTVMGIGMLYVFAPTPTPPSHVFGGVVQIDRVP